MPNPYSEFLEEYVKRRFTDIFIIDYSHREDPGGYENEHTSETVVAKQDGEFVRVDVYLEIDFSPRGGRDLMVGTPIQISEEMYQHHAKGKLVVDTPEARQKVVANLEAERLRKEAEAQLRKIAPTCPIHQVLLLDKLNSKKGTRFWGCPRYPQCYYTQNFTTEHRRLSALASTKSP